MLLLVRIRTLLVHTPPQPKEDTPRRPLETRQEDPPIRQIQGTLLGQGDEPLWIEGRMDFLDRTSLRLPLPLPLQLFVYLLSSEREPVCSLSLAGNHPRRRRHRQRHPQLPPRHPTVQTRGNPRMVTPSDVAQQRRQRGRRGRPSRRGSGGGRVQGEF